MAILLGRGWVPLPAIAAAAAAAVAAVVAAAVVVIVVVAGLWCGGFGHGIENVCS